MSPRQYTYPLALLDQFPHLPPPDTIDALYRSFNQTCLQHVFLDRLPTSFFQREATPVAPLKFGMACLAAISTNNNNVSGAPESLPETLFSAGVSLWLAMVEMDNTLARSIDMLLAAVLLVPCGVMSTSSILNTRAALLLPASLTVGYSDRTNVLCL